MNRNMKILLLFAFCCAGLWFLFYGPTQINNIRAAQRHAPVVMRALSHYPEFKDVRADAGTGSGGVFVVIGQVATTNQLTLLKKTVMETKPPAKTVFRVRISDQQHDPPRRASGIDPSQP